MVSAAILTTVDFLPIHTAPRDSTVIELAAFDSNGRPDMVIEMRWQADAENALFPGIVGFWVTPDHPGPHSLTWNESDPAGAPTHWRPARTN
ncbi:hypothetical protein D3877_16240 [Azospirillum cavernae]|uniref:Uncharacterized protein n=1 Tax=Azospirillum cavernae TaxID=2320860 RepID=A0A418VWY8_9PROT|nr:hypothetical protein [Azospirillum cavernae]RJF81671.1 hypothetical protein D3877_16240 [Azospirillum cavernae]